MGGGGGDSKCVLRQTNLLFVLVFSLDLLTVSKTYKTPPFKKD